MPVKSQFSYRLIHVAIVVRDIGEAIKRLTNLGMGPFEPFDPGSLPEITEKSLYKG